MENDFLMDQKIRIHHDHREWLDSFNFYEDEIKFFQSELELVLHKNSNSYSKLDNYNEYKKILDKKLFIIEDLRSEIEYQKKIFDVDEIVDENISYHLELKDKFQNFIKNFESLKKNLKRFAAHND